MRTVHLPWVLALAACAHGCSKGAVKSPDGAVADVAPAAADADRGVDVPVMDAPVDRSWPDLYAGDRPPVRDAGSVEVPVGSPFAPESAFEYLDEFNPDSSTNWQTAESGASSRWRKTRDVSAQLDMYSMVSGITDGWSVIYSTVSFAWNQIVEVRLRVVEQAEDGTAGQVMVMGRYLDASDRGVGLALRGDGTVASRLREQGIVSSYGHSVSLASLGSPSLPPYRLGEWYVVRVNLIGDEVSTYFHGQYVANIDDAFPASRLSSVAIGVVGMKVDIDWVRVTTW